MLLSAVRAAVVDHPEHALGPGVGLAGHDLLDQPVKRRDPGLLLAAAGQLTAVHVPGSEVAERATAVVVVLDALRTASRGSGGRVGPLPSLDLRLFDYPNAMGNRAARRGWGSGWSGGS